MSDPRTHPIPPEALKNDYPVNVYAHDVRPPDYVAYLDRGVAAIKALRLIVYAGMAGFLLLSAYGFFLVYELTSDAHRMVGEAMVMGEQMQAMARIMSNMRESIADMRGDTYDMRTSVAELDRQVGVLTLSVSHMTQTVDLIQHSARNLDASIAPSAHAMNSFLPFGRSPFIAPPFAPPLR